MLYVQMAAARQLPLLGDPDRPSRLRLLAASVGPSGAGCVALAAAPSDAPTQLALPSIDGHRPEAGLDRSSHPTRADTCLASPPPVAAVARFRQRVHMTSLDPARNRARFYALAWQPGLWGGGALVRTWGRLDTPGRSLTTRYDSREAAQAAITALLRRRLRHGYRVVECR